MRTGATLPLDRFQQAYRAGISRNLRTENGPFLHPLVQRRSVYSMFLGGTKCLGAPGSGAGFTLLFVLLFLLLRFRYLSYSDNQIEAPVGPKLTLPIPL